MTITKASKIWDCHPNSVEMAITKVSREHLIASGRYDG